MKLKIKLTTSSIIKYLYIVIIVSFFVSLYFLYTFVDKYVLQTFNYEYKDTSELSSDIDMKKFDSILENIEKKSKGNDANDIRNVFE